MEQKITDAQKSANERIKGIRDGNIEKWEAELERRRLETEAEKAGNNSGEAKSGSYLYYGISAEKLNKWASQPFCGLLREYYNVFKKFPKYNENINIAPTFTTTPFAKPVVKLSSFMTNKEYENLKRLFDDAYKAAVTISSSGKQAESYIASPSQGLSPEIMAIAGLSSISDGPLPVGDLIAFGIIILFAITQTQGTGALKTQTAPPFTLIPGNGKKELNMEMVRWREIWYMHGRNVLTTEQYRVLE